MNGNSYCCGSAHGFSGKNSPTGLLFPYFVTLSGVYSANGTRIDQDRTLKGTLAPYPEFRPNHSQDDCFCRASG